MFLLLLLATMKHAGIFLDFGMQLQHVYDVAVIGAGAMGSAATYFLSKTGKKILVLDKYVPPHHLGSSHGQSRIIREAYFESPSYVPLVQQAYRLWDDLERESGKKLFIRTGGLMIGNKDQKVFHGASLSAVQRGITYEFLDHEAIKKRFPVFKPSPGTVALFENNAGILFPEECIRTFLELATNHDVDFHFNEEAISIKSRNGKVEIVTGKGKYEAGKVIVSTGAWITSLFPDLQLPLEVKRQLLFWFKCTSRNAEEFSPQNFPVYIWEHEKNKIFYGFPDLGEGVKIAIHHQGELTTADTINRKAGEEEINAISTIIRRYFDARFTYNYSEVCMYTNTPDENFIIDFYPANRNIIIVSACSGHGFKFSSAIGKILSEMALDKKLSFDISPFNIARLIGKEGSPD